MNKKVTYPSIPRVAGQKGDVVALTQFAEILAGSRGDGLDRALTPRDLIDLGILDGEFRSVGTGKYLNLTAGSSTGGNNTYVTNVVGGGGGGYDPVIESPNTPTGVSAGGAQIHTFVEWDAPSFEGFSHAEIWRSNVDDYAMSVRIGTTQGTIYSDAVGVGKSYYYWVRFVNISDDVGPIHATNGVFAQTSADISSILAELSEQLGNGDITLDASTFAVEPAGGSTTYPFVVLNNVTYIATALIRDASITNAKIANLDVDKITGDTASFVIANINASTIQNAMIGQYIQSTDWSAVNHTGWKIDKAGDAEFNNIKIYDDSTGELIFQSGAGTQTPGFDWAYVLGVGKPEDYATAGADWNTNIANKPTGLVQTFYQPDEPVSASIGDFWIDTDDNKYYRWDGAGWTLIQDADIVAALANAATAQATADGKINTFAQASEPTAEGVGDLWVDVDAANKLYRWDGSSWVDYAQDSAAWVKVFGYGRPENWASSGSNLFNDYNFTNKYNGDESAWVDNASAIYNTTGKNGESAVVISPNGFLNTVWNDKYIPAKEGDKFYNRMTINSTLDGDYGFYVGYYDSDFALISTEWTNQRTGNSSGWVDYDGNVTVTPVNTAFVRFGLSVEDNATTGTVTFDKVYASAIPFGAIGIGNKISSLNINNYMDVAVIEEAYIGDAQVGTLKIKENAVVIPVSVFTSGQLNLSAPNAWNVVAQATIDADGQPVNIAISFSYALRAKADSENQVRAGIEVRVYRDSTSNMIYSAVKIDEAEDIDNGASAYYQGPSPEVFGAYSVSMKDTPTDGNHTYYVSVRGTTIINPYSSPYYDASGGTTYIGYCHISRRSMVLLGVKR